MLHKEIIGLGLLFFILWIFMGGDASDRLERGCKPVAWAANVVGSVAALGAPKYQNTVQQWGDNLNYSCEFTGWRLFYSADYAKWVADQQAAGLNAAPASGPTAIPVTPPAPLAAPAVPAQPAAAPTARKEAWHAQN